MRRGSAVRFVAIALAVVPLLAAAPKAKAVTIGEVRDTGIECVGGPTDVVQKTVTSGSYTVPDFGASRALSLTSWSHLANNTAGQMLTMKVYRKVGEPNRYLVVGHDGPRSLASGTLNTFPASVVVQPGDVLGLALETPDSACFFDAPAGNMFTGTIGSDLADGQSGDLNTSSANTDRLNVSAEVGPTNTFTLGKVTLNKNKGTATVTGTFPNPGTVTESGKGVKRANSSGARAAVSVPTAGKMKLSIRAKGKKRKTLNSAGKVKVVPKFTYTPSGGTALTVKRKVKLRKTL